MAYKNGGGMAPGMLLPAVFFLARFRLFGPESGEGLSGSRGRRRCARRCVTASGRAAAGRMLLILFFLAGALRMGAELLPDPLEGLLEAEGKIRYAEAKGRIVRVTEKNGVYSVLLSEVSIRARGESVSQKRLMVTVSEGPDFAEADWIHVSGTLELYKEARNPGEFDARLYYRSKKIRFRLRADEIKKAEGRPPLFRRQTQAFLRASKEAMAAVFEPEDLGIYQAVLLGDRSELSKEIKRLFEDSGISHILAVSGLHVSLIGLSLFGFLRKAGCSCGGAGLAAGAALFFYGAVTGFGPSVYRAVFMLLCSFLAAYLGRTYDLLSAMALSLLFLAWDSPFLLMTGGLQLSYGAVAAIGLEMERQSLWRRRRERLQQTGRREQTDQKERTERMKGAGQGKREGQAEQGPAARLTEAVSVSLAIQLVTLPMLLYHFFSFPVWGLLLNLLVIPLMSYAAGSGILAAGLFMLGRLASGILPGAPGKAALWLLEWTAHASAGPGHYIFALYERLCAWSRMLPFSSVAAGRPQWWQTAVYYIVLIWFYGEPGAGQDGTDRRPIGVRKSGAVRGGLLFLAVLFLFLRPIHGLDIWFLDVGQGDGALLRTSEVTILSDCGSSQDKAVGENRLLPFLQSQGIRHLDYILVSHADSDHINGITWLLEEETDISADCLILPAAGRGGEEYDRLEALAEAKKMTVHYMARGESLNAGPLRISCLHPEEPGLRPDGSSKAGSGGTEDRNGHSLVLFAEYGSFRMLLTGDIGADQERELVEKDLREVSVLKAAHHGSAGSSSREFLEAVRPAAVILSYGKGNSYGHPAGETMKRLEAGHARIWHTARSGAIRVWTDGRRMKIKGFLSEPVDKAGEDGL